MKYWMIKDGNSEGPFSLEELTGQTEIAVHMLN